jgi:hypothetical protein
VIALQADRSLKYGVGLAVALVVLITVWSWRTLRQVSVAPPLPPVHISGSAKPIAVVTIGSRAGSGVAAPADTTAPSNTSVSTAHPNAPVGSQTSVYGQSVASQTPPKATKQPAASPVSAGISNAKQTTAPLPNVPEQPSLLDHVVSTLLSLL